MNIPDEVIESWFRSEGYYSARVPSDTSRAFRAGAEWALREAAEAINVAAKSALGGRLNASQMQFRKGYAYGANDARESVRALAEGEDNA